MKMLEVIPKLHQVFHVFLVPSYSQTSVELNECVQVWSIIMMIVKSWVRYDWKTFVMSFFDDILELIIGWKSHSDEAKVCICFGIM